MILKDSVITRRKKYEELLKETFEYLFTNIIKHINIICFTTKSIDSRLDDQAKYIFSSSTSLFAEDASKNFIFLTTFANDVMIESGPTVIDLFKDNDNFNNIIKKFDEKWYYVIDSLSILRNRSSDLAKYSYEQLFYLYKKIFKNFKNISVNNSLQIITNRFKIKNIIKYIYLLYDDIKTYKNEIHNIDNKLSELKGNIKSTSNKIEYKKSEIDSVYIINKDYHLNMLKTKLDNYINRLDDDYETRNVRILRLNGVNNTYCNYCKSNCHYNCNCYISFLLFYN